MVKKYNIDYKKIKKVVDHTYPVSYTHLDVYKRQALAASANALALAAPARAYWPLTEPNALSL